MLTIYDNTGAKRFETPINKGSKRVFKLMADDYVTLVFSVANPVYFKLGDYCDIPGFGRFELVGPYKPTYNKSTNGYDYELKLEAQHMKWRNKIMRYLPSIGGAECAWSLTATADVHLSQVLENINALITEIRMDGEQVVNQRYLYNGATQWAIAVDDNVSATAKSVNYDQTNIIDALTAIAEAYECEWWLDGNIIHLGKCEADNDYVDLELGVNVAEMSRSDSSEDYVTRILAFGSERNISPRYRKDLIFDVKEVDYGGNYISDTSRPLNAEWFASSMVETSPSDSTIKRVKDITIEIIDGSGNVTSTLAGAVYNPSYASALSDQNWIQLPGSAVMQAGQRFRIANILEKKVKSSYFSSRYSAYDNISSVVRNGIVTNRLMLPVSHGTPYVDFKPGLSMEEGVEDVVIFEDVYPRAVCAVTSVDTVPRKETIENDDGTTTETTFTAYQIKDDFFTSAHPFDNDYIVPNQTLKITFQDGKRYEDGDEMPDGKKVGDLVNPESGKLNGWTFEVRFTKDGDGSAIWEIVRDNAAYIPSDVLRPEIGDQFILEGFDIALVDDLYVEVAENELLEKANKYLEKLNTDPSTYDCTMMPDVMKDGLALGLGKRVNLINDAYIEPTTDENGKKWGRKSRIIGFEIPLDIPYDNPVYTVGEKAAYSRFGDIEDKIDALKFSMASGNSYFGGILSGSSSAGSGIYVIKQTDITPASETNVYSALRACLEFTSKKAKETINYLWSFMQGIRVGNYVLNNSGAKIDPNGDAEFEDVVIRGGASVGEDLSVDGDATVGNEITVKKGITIGDSYQPGVYGGRVWVDDNGKVHIETDYLEAREKIEAKEVEIQEETHVGGCQIISPAAMRCSRVIPIYNEANSVIAYKCFFTAEDETGAQIFNQFEVGDLAKCETFNLTKQPSGKMGNHYFWRKVVEVGYVNNGDADYDADYGMEGYITLSNLASEKDAASDAPLAGDRIITVGNSDPAKTDRSNLIILASYGTGSPYIYQYKGINTFALTKDNLKVAISPNGNVFTGKVVIENNSEEIDVRDYIENNIYLEAYQLVLSNEMAGVPCDVDGDPIGDLPSTKVTIYKGKTVEAGWTVSTDAVGCVASMVGDTVYLSALTSKNATVTVTATKQDCPTLTKVMTICKLKEGEAGVSGDHAVQFEVEPDKPMVLADMDGICDPAALGCKVYMVIGNQNRVEVPLANTAPITTYKAGEKLLFFNGRLFVSRPVEVDVPTDLVLRYVIVNQDYTTDEETGKVTPVVVSESEHIYTGIPITTASRMKHIIFKLYRGSVLVDMQTVVVTTDATAMKVAYNTRFEVNEKEILAHASRIAQNEEGITDLLMTAEGISADITKQSGIIRDFINGAGRNLLLKTNQGSANWAFLTDSGADAVVAATAADEEESQPPSAPFSVQIGERTDATYEVFTYALRPELIKAGEKYTLTFDIQNLSSQINPLEFYAQIANNNGTGALTDAPHFENIVASGDEQTLSVTLTATSDGVVTGTQRVYIAIVAASLNDWTNLVIKNLKLEKGETQTAYSAAPEDSPEYVYSSLNAKINVTAEGIRSEVEQEIGKSEERITSQYASLIQQTADEILTQVEDWDDELGASISEIRQTADSISLKVDEIAGYENLVTGCGTGQGWVASGSNGALVAVEPDDGVYYIENGSAASTKYLRTPLFTLRANTKYTLSFVHGALSNKISGFTASVKYGDTAATLVSQNFAGLIFGNVATGKEIVTFETGGNVVEDAFVEFAHLGMTQSAQTSEAIISISQVILEIGETAHPFVDDAAGLLATGIDIYNRRIVFTADNIIFQGNNGERSMFIDENGRILAKFINAEELRVSHLIAGDENGQRVEIDPSVKAVEIYNGDNELCTTLNGHSHSNGIADLYGNSQEGTINAAFLNPSGYAVNKGQLAVQGSAAGSNQALDVYSEVWQADTPTSVIIGVGNIYVYAYASGYTESSSAAKSSASGYAYLYLEVADDTAFTQNKKSWLIHSARASAAAAYQPYLNGDEQRTGSGNYYSPSDSANSNQILDGKSVKATSKGYCRLRLSIGATAYHSGSSVSIKWGSNATGGRDLTATWKNEFYVSNFFANGFCLGIRKDKYIIAYKDGSDGMRLEMEDGGFGLKFSKQGIQTKHHGGNWMPMPQLVWKARIRRYTASGANSDKYYIENQKSFNNETIAWTNVTRAESGNHIHVTIPFPSSWEAMAMNDANTIVNLTGYGDDKTKGTLVSISPTAMVVEMSDDASANDGALIIELFII